MTTFYRVVGWLYKKNNMELKNQVCNFELSKKLKELGVKQESLFYWRLGYSTSESFDNGVSLGKQGHFRDYELSYYPKPRYTTADVKWNENDLRKLNETEVSAFTVAEQGEMLPTYLWFMNQETYIRFWRNNAGDYHYAGYATNVVLFSVEDATTEANARAKMLIYLLEHKLITLD